MKTTKRHVEKLKKHPAYEYARGVVDGKIIANKSVIAECNRFIEDLEVNQFRDDFDFCFSMDKFIKVELFLTLFVLTMDSEKYRAKDVLKGYQMFLIFNTLCWVAKDNEDILRYEKVVFYIPRKNGKTLVAAIIMLIHILLGNNGYSDYYSLAPTKALSTIVLNEVKKIISDSPVLNSNFKITKDKITYVSDTHTAIFESLANNKGKLDGRLASVFVIDEEGAMDDRSGILAMETSQVSSLVKSGLYISTAYPNTNNPMVDEVEQVKDNIEKGFPNERLFGMLYEPDYPDKWQDLDSEIFKANPLAADKKAIKDSLFKSRETAITGINREEFLTKNMNIMVDGQGLDDYIDSMTLDKAFSGEDFDWRGKDVYLGLDLSVDDDNTSLSMIHYDRKEHKLYAKSWAFFPEELMLKKSKEEGYSYDLIKEREWGYALEGNIVSFPRIAEFILNLEESYGVNIISLGYDAYRANTLMLEVNKGFEDKVDLIKVKQNIGTLGESYVYIKEMALKGKLKLDENDYFKQNFLNAKKKKLERGDYQLVKRQRSKKIDMIVSFVTAVVVFLEAESQYKEERVSVIEAYDNIDRYRR